MSKRDSITTVARLKEYLQRQPKRGNDVVKRANVILKLLKLLSSKRKESAAVLQMESEYLTVKLVALLQDGMRCAVRDVVNHAASKDEKMPTVEGITLDMVIEFQNKAYTIGDFVAHTFPYNSMEQIASSIERVTGKNLLELRKRFTDALKEPQPESPEDEHKQDWQVIEKLFSRRNVICHEQGLKVGHNKSEMFDEMIAVYSIVAFVGYYAEIEVADIGSKKAKQ